jgi:hypothetical protein
LGMSWRDKTKVSIEEKEIGKKGTKLWVLEKELIKKWILSNQEEPWDCNKRAIVALPLVGVGWRIDT